MVLYGGTPDTRKFIEVGNGHNFSYVVTTMRYCYSCPNPYVQAKEDNSIFAVFDGMNDVGVAMYAQKNFQNLLKANENYKKGMYKEALKQTFLEIDNQILSKAGFKEMIDISEDMGRALRSFNLLGYQLKMDWLQKRFMRYLSQKEKQSIDDRLIMGACSANVVLITPKEIFCANAGHCRTIASVKGKCVELSQDHVYSNEQQKERIIKSGSCQIFDLTHHGFDGYIKCSRGFGAFKWKRGNGKYQNSKGKKISPEECAFTANPEIITIKNENIDFIVMGTSGTWDRMSSKDMFKWVNKQIKEGVCNELMFKKHFEENVGTQQEIDETHYEGCHNMTAIYLRPMKSD